MTKSNDAEPARKPSRQELLRPAEMVGGAAILSVFVGLVVLFSTREWYLAGIFFGVAFIVTLVVLAMFALGFKPNESEQQDLAEQNGEAGGAASGDAASGDAGNGGSASGTPGGAEPPKPPVSPH
jgi:hypothetical protein